VRQLLGINRFIADRPIRRAAANREIIAADHDLATINAPRAVNKVRWRECRQRAVFVSRAACQCAALVKRIGIEQAGNAFAHRQTAIGMMARNVRFAAHLFGQFDAAFDLFDFRLPGQVSVSRGKMARDSLKG
jgi:hypothetical protein